jgi:hypothetical protein
MRNFSWRHWPRATTLQFLFLSETRDAAQSKLKRLRRLGFFKRSSAQPAKRHFGKTRGSTPRLLLQIPRPHCASLFFRARLPSARNCCAFWPVSYSPLRKTSSAGIVNDGSSWKNRSRRKRQIFLRWFGGEAAQKMPAVRSITVACVAMNAFSEPRWPSPAKTPPGSFRSRKKSTASAGKFCRRSVASNSFIRCSRETEVAPPCNPCCAAVLQPGGFKMVRAHNGIAGRFAHIGRTVGVFSTTTNFPSARLPTSQIVETNTFASA